MNLGVAKKDPCVFIILNSMHLKELFMLIENKQEGTKLGCCGLSRRQILFPV